MNTDRAAAQLNAIHHDVIVLATDFLRFSFQERNVRRHRSRERMMAGIPAILFAIEAQQRKFNYPQEIKSARVNCELAFSLQDIRAIETNLAENFAGVQ